MLIGLIYAMELIAHLKLLHKLKGARGETHHDLNPLARLHMLYTSRE